MKATSKGKRSLICPKCGSVSVAFNEKGYVNCKRCNFTARKPRFQTGGPGRVDDDPNYDTLGYGARWRTPIRYDED